jgi:hypothetical protein
MKNKMFDEIRDLIHNYDAPPVVPQAISIGESLINSFADNGETQRIQSNLKKHIADNFNRGIIQQMFAVGLYNYAASEVILCMFNSIVAATSGRSISPDQFMKIEEKEDIIFSMTSEPLSNEEECITETTKLLLGAWQKMYLIPNGQFYCACTVLSITPHGMPTYVKMRVLNARKT